MKKFFVTILSAIVGLFGYTLVDSAIEDRVSSLENRVSYLESIVEEYHATTKFENASTTNAIGGIVGGLTGALGENFSNGYIVVETNTSTVFDETRQWITTPLTTVKTELKRDDTLAQAIVDQINADRAEAGLEPLEHETNLKATARTNSMATVMPDVYGEPSSYCLVTTYGGNPVYQQVAAANNATIMSADTTQIGVGVVVYEGKYYTTVIFE